MPTSALVSYPHAALKNHGDKRIFLLFVCHLVIASYVENTITRNTPKEILADAELSTQDTKAEDASGDARR
jgi:hypothetical protein